MGCVLLFVLSSNPTEQHLNCLGQIGLDMESSPTLEMVAFGGLSSRLFQALPFEDLNSKTPKTMEHIELLASCPSSKFSLTHL